MPGQDAVALLHLGTDDVVEQRPHRRNDEVQRPGDEQGAMAEGAMGPDPGEAFGERAGEELGVEELPRIVSQPGDGAPSKRR